MEKWIAVLGRFARVLNIEQQACNDPTHFHQAPVQICVSLEVPTRNGRTKNFEVTKDGSTFHVREEGSPATERTLDGIDAAIAHIDFHV